MAYRTIIGVEAIQTLYKWILIEYNNKKINVLSNGILDTDLSLNLDCGLKKSLIKTTPVILSMASDQFKRVEHQLLEKYPELKEEYYLAPKIQESVIVIPKKNFTNYIKIFNKRPVRLVWLETYQQTILRTIKQFLPKISLFGATNQILVISGNAYYINLDLITNYQHKLSVNISIQNSKPSITETIIEYAKTNNLNLSLILLAVKLENINKDLLSIICKNIQNLNIVIGEHFENIDVNYQLSLLAAQKIITPKSQYV
jgi:hypothetical protein